MAVKVRTYKTITLCSLYLPPRNHFNFNHQLSSPFILMRNFNGHHILWGCEKVNNRVKQLEDLILKHYLIIVNDISSTYFHPVNGTFTSIELTLCSHTLYLEFSRRISPALVVVTTSQLFWRMVDHHLLKGFRDGS